MTVLDLWLPFCRSCMICEHFPSVRQRDRQRPLEEPVRCPGSRRGRIALPHVQGAVGNAVPIGWLGKLSLVQSCRQPQRAHDPRSPSRHPCLTGRACEQFSGPPFPVLRFHARLATVCFRAPTQEWHADSVQPAGNAPSLRNISRFYRHDRFRDSTTREGAPKR